MNYVEQMWPTTLHWLHIQTELRSCLQLTSLTMLLLYKNIQSHSISSSEYVQIYCWDNSSSNQWFVPLHTTLIFYIYSKYQISQNNDGIVNNKKCWRIFLIDHTIVCGRWWHRSGFRHRTDRWPMLARPSCPLVFVFSIDYLLLQSISESVLPRWRCLMRFPHDSSSTLAFGCVTVRRERRRIMVLCCKWENKREETGDINLNLLLSISHVNNNWNDIVTEPQGFRGHCCV